MFFCGKSWSSSSEALRLRSSALFGRQAAWRRGAFVDKLCQRRSVHLSCSSWRLSGLGVYAPKARSTKFVVDGKGLQFLVLVHSVVPTRAVLASETRTHGPVWIDDGKELLRH